MSAFKGTIRDIEEKYIDLVPIGLRYDMDYLLIFALVSKDCEIDLDSLETPEDVADISKTSYKYVDSLWQYFNSNNGKWNPKVNKVEKAKEFYKKLLDSLIAYGTEKGYLTAYEYLVPDNLPVEKDRAYKAYLVHLIEFYKDEVDTAETPEDLENPDKMSLDALYNIWSYYNYNVSSVPTEEEKEDAKYITNILKELWVEKREEYLYMVPEYLRTNDGFLVFLSLMIHEFDISYENIDKFTDLVDTDKVPLKYLEYLGMYMNYKYIDRAQEDFNRELITDMRSIWEMRGSNHAIIMAATHGYNPGYVGGDIFIPGFPITSELAEIIIGTERVFVHSKSKFSCIDVYPDGFTYRPGVIIIIVPFVNDNIRRKINEVIPAGIRYVFWLWIAAQSNNPEETGKYGEMMFHIQVVTLQSRGEPRYTYDPFTDTEISVPANLYMFIEPTIYYENEGAGEAFVHSESRFPYYDLQGNPLSRPLLSGLRMYNIIDVLRIREPIACALRVGLLSQPYLSPTFEGTYIISPTGEYLDTKTPDGRPGIGAILRKFLDTTLEENTLILESNVPEIDIQVDGHEDFDDRSLAVSALPISLQSTFFACGVLKATNISFYEGDTLVGENFSIPFSLLDGNTEVGVINKSPILMYEDNRYLDIDYYIISPTGEYLDTIDKKVNTIERINFLDYRPEIEIDFLPA